MEKIISISINFCGGCNPRIERGKIAAAIKETLAADGFEVVYNRPAAAFMIYLSGCTAGCAFRYRKSPAPGTAIAASSVDAVAVSEEDIVAEVVKKVRDYFARLA